MLYRGGRIAAASVSSGFAVAGYICEGSFQRFMILLFFVVSGG
jgi:hypothetical protein